MPAHVATTRTSIACYVPSLLRTGSYKTDPTPRPPQSPPHTVNSRTGIPAWNDELSAIALLRRWTLCGLLFALSFARVWAQSTSLTEEECEAQGRQIAKLLSQKKTEALLDMFDLAANFELVTDGLDLDERRKILVRDRYQSSALRSLKTTLRHCDSARFIRVDWVDGSKRVLIRAHDNETASYNYIGFTLARDDFSGGIKIIDLHDYLAGETISQQTRGILKTLLTVQNQSTKDRSAELVESHLENLDRVEAASHLVATRQFKEALEELKPLPEVWKKQRFILYLRYLASQHADHDEYQPSS